jgi:hypothetical protein
MLVELLNSFIHSTNFLCILLGYILHRIPQKIYILLLHSQCFEFYLKQTMLLLEFIVLSKNIVIVERFDVVSLLQNMLQPFINNFLPLKVFVHLCLFLLKLLLYFMFGLVYITNILSELFELLLSLQENLLHIPIAFSNWHPFAS